MTISVWRYSHLALAVSSFIFIALAAITGFILAFQPVSGKISSHRIPDFKQVTLAQTIPALKKTYPGISDITIDINQNVIIKGTDAGGKKVLAYADPLTGKLLGNPGKPNEFFQWITALHRSLFLHEAGRFFVGLTAFLLLLIAVSGTILVIQRQRGLKRFFSKVVKENFAHYYHVVIGRLSLIPIILIALTGTWLSLSRFGFFPEKKIKHQINFDIVKSEPQIKPGDFKIFQQTYLTEVQSIEYPFSEFPEDYYKLKLKDRELVVNQFTGEVLSEVKYPAKAIISGLSLDLHTGRASSIWAIVLAIACLNILFFIYSGLIITLKRRANRLIKNKYKAAESEYTILIGSENGSTFRYANNLHRQLIKQGKKSFVTELNSYQVFPQASHIIVMTATYGLGDAPTNADKFLKLLQQHPQQRAVNYSVVGFGSHAYPDFCRFAFEVNQALAHQPWATALTDIHTVNDRSPQEINLWAEAWSQQSGINLNALAEAETPAPKDLKQFKVTAHIPVSDDDHTFTLRLLPQGKAKVTSGDLLAIYPADDHRERLYSIGVIGKELQLSIRLHPGGLGSQFLNGLNTGQILKARVVANPHFHFPAKATSVVMIANGTGIAPFLGMIAQNKSKTTIGLYCGFRENSSFKRYYDFLESEQAAGRLNSRKIALSREGNKEYVSAQIIRDGEAIADTLKSGGAIMICGSLAMQRDVLAALENICTTFNTKPLSFYQSHGQLLTDCY